MNYYVNMRSVTAVRLTTQILLMLSILWSGIIITDAYDRAVAYNIILLATMAAAAFARRWDLAYLKVIFHMIAVAISIYFGLGVYNFDNWYYVVAGVYVFFSLIASLRRSEFMDRANAFQMAVFVVDYLVLYTYARHAAIIGTVLIFTYAILFFLQNKLENNNEDIEKIRATTECEYHRIRMSTTIVTFVFVMMVALVAIGVSFVGNTKPARAVNDGSATALKKAVEYVKTQASGEKTTTADEGSYVEPPKDNTEYENSETVSNTVAIVIVGIVALACILYGTVVYIRYRIKNNDDSDDVVVVTTKIEKHEAEDEPLVLEEDDDAYLSNRKQIRKLYRKRLLKNRGNRNDDLRTRTPYEQRDRRLDEGENIEIEFVNEYERARYSNKKITKDDIVRMKRGLF